MASRIQGIPVEIGWGYQETHHCLKIGQYRYPYHIVTASAVAIQKIAATGEDLKNLGDKISGVGTTLTKDVTTPIVGLGTVAVKTAADFDTAMSQVAAVSGATGSDLDALRDKARDWEWKYTIWQNLRLLQKFSFSKSYGAKRFKVSLKCLRNL